MSEEKENAHGKIPPEELSSLRDMFLQVLREEDENEGLTEETIEMQRKFPITHRYHRIHRVVLKKNSHHRKGT